MLAFAQRDVPVGRFDIARVDDAGEHVVDALIANFAARQILWEGWLAFKKALYFDLCFEASRGVAFERFLQDRSVGLITHQYLAMPANPLVAVAHRCLKNPITVLDPCPHAVHGLLSVLLALMLRHRRQKVFDELRVRIFPELDRRADEHAARVADLHAQLEVSHQAASKAADVIDDNSMRLFAVRIQEGQHRLHARA